ncbi:MAG: 50S ribosomal protein L11 methyltransferase [Candidatus Levybacteria bacterium]|nr:50S ribosomal protein L11 methyltransferase [Candidatus Levybacteria bacterium]
MFFWIFNIAILLIIIILFILLSWFWPPDSPWAPWWRTNKKTARAICLLARVGKKDIVYDLGSGDGTALIVASKEFGAKGVGIEIDPLRFLISKVRIKLNGLDKNISIVKNNFYNKKISDATVVFVYLVPRVLRKLKPKFLKELKKGTRIVSLRYKIDLPLRKYDKENQIRMYVI